MSSLANAIHIVVDTDGTQLAYLDSGVPAGSTGTYTTVFAVHGTQFGFHIYDKLLAPAHGSDLRLVAISRRGYPGSTPFAPGEVTNLSTGTDDQKTSFLHARGSEVANFIVKFVNTHDLPPLNADGTAGGIALIGWSLGCAIVLSIISQIENHPDSVQETLKTHLRALILHEPAPVAIGAPLAPKSWGPQLCGNLTAEQGQLLGAQWLTSYFKHDDLSSRDLDAVEYVVPTTSKPPSIFSMSDAQVKYTLSLPAGVEDALWYMSSGPQMNASYKKALFDQDVRAKLPHLKAHVLVGDATISFCVTSSWQVEHDNAEAGGGLLNIRWLPGANHFIHWDEPERTVQLLLETIAA